MLPLPLLHHHQTDPLPGYGSRVAGIRHFLRPGSLSCGLQHDPVGQRIGITGPDGLYCRAIIVPQGDPADNLSSRSSFFKLDHYR